MEKNISRISWGIEPSFNQVESFTDEKMQLGRIIRVSRGQYLVAKDDKIINAKISGAFRYKTVLNSEYPAIGDWVLFKQSEEDDENFALIEWVFPRKSCVSRKSAGIKTDEQVIAANIDVIFLVFAINGGRNFVQAGLERYLTLAWDSGALPVVILNKADLCTEEEKEVALLKAESSAPGVDVRLISAETGEGLDNLISNLSPKTTIALIGPSGVGKSTIVNTLRGTSTQKTAAQRSADLRGRHTTTHRELFRLPSGLLLIDNPGMRELQLWTNTDSTEEAFTDIAEFAKHCRFADCSHQGEPGCAVQEALSNGKLEYRRFENYIELKKELDYLQLRQSGAPTGKRQKKVKEISKQIKKYYKDK